MNSKTKTILISIIALSLTTSTFAYEDKGFQYWSAASVSSKINKEWKIVVEEEFRIGDDGGNLYYQHTDLGFVYSGFSNNIDIGFNYRNIQEKNSEDNTRPENRPHLNLTLKGKLFNLTTANRSRLEFRDKDNKEDVWRYRNKTTIKLLPIPNFKNIQPYIANEVFIDLDRNDFTKNRFYAGATFKLAGNTKLDIFYLWQAIKSKREWEDTQILGTHIKFSF